MLTPRPVRPRLLGRRRSRPSHRRAGDHRDRLAQSFARNMFCGQGRGTPRLGPTSPSPTCRASRPIRRSTAASDCAVLVNSPTASWRSAAPGMPARSKSVFTILNYILPTRTSAHARLGQYRAEGRRGDLFGLSGTGKTTLSANPSRTLIGDDGTVGARPACSTSRAAPCKVIALARPSPRSMPPPSALARCWKTWCTIPRPAASTSMTAGIPRTRAPAIRSSSSPTPRRQVLPRRPNIVMLTPTRSACCRRFHGSPEQAISLPVGLHRAWPARKASPSRATFSTCFGALHASSDSLRQDAGREDGRQNVKCWLVNTGWSGGSFGVGERMSIRRTRARCGRPSTARWRRSRPRPIRTSACRCRAPV